MERNVYSHREFSRRGNDMELDKSDKTCHHYFYFYVLTLSELNRFTMHTYMYIMGIN